jgi:enamine deaminase RidA (YjgF/YER057c/UK114 family)
VASGGFRIVSGQVGSTDDGSPHADPRAQLRLALANLNSVLAAAGCTFADVVDINVFIVDPEKLMPVFFNVKEDFWGEPPYPPLMGISVTWLYGFDFELKVTARLPAA